MSLEEISTQELEELLEFGDGISWRNGDLYWKLKPVQKEILDDIEACEFFKYVLECSRRLGKSFLLCVIAIQDCLKIEACLIRYASSTRLEMRKYIHPIMNIILKDCPEEIKPKWKHYDQAYFFPKNDSQIHLAGVNNGRENELRGTACHKFIIDEGGNVTNLKYLVKSVAMPQLLDADGNVVKERKILIAGTPPRSPAHEFASMCEEAEAGNAGYAHYDIYSAGYPAETIELFCKEAGGPDSSTWKREYLALRVVDEEYAVIPEWNDKNCHEFARDEYSQFYYNYVALDVGVKHDFTAVLFAYYDFKKTTLFICDEFVMKGPQMTTDSLVAAIREKEKKVFVHDNKPLEVKRRVMDEGLLLGNDLRKLHGLHFSETSKGKLEEMVNEVRIWCKDDRIVVHPRCVQTHGCLKYGTWDENRKQWDRSETYGHFDSLAALVYMVRNVDHRTNPIPRHYGKSEDDFWIPEKESSGVEDFKKALNITRRGRYAKKRF